MSIGIVLCTYKRRNIREQLAAIKAQTVAPGPIVCWRNDSWPDDVFEQLSGLDYVRASKNMGVWPRFLLGATLDVKYVAVFDDDTIPGTRWLENCQASYESRPGLYGTNWIRFTSHSYRSSKAIGWKSRNSEIEEVDLVGHAWFMPRELCHRIYDVRKVCPIAGEDMALSFIAQRMGLATLVPPHPSSDQSLWGSIRGMELGRDGNGISSKSENWKSFQSELYRLRSCGWRLLCDG